MIDVGSRVGAIQSADETAVKLFGYGTYIGMEEHPDLGMVNPKIQLDSGEIVWGCECWWASEKEITEKVAWWTSRGSELQYTTVQSFREEAETTALEANLDGLFN